MNHLITVAYGDGIGPEIMEATLYVLKEAHAPIQIETIEIGKLQYERGFKSGIAPEAWDSINRSKLLLKAPITTPQGGGYKSLNVTLRKALGLYANVRPCVSYHPLVPSLHPGLDMVIVRENEEDLYMGIEHRPSASTYECLKVITQPGCERIMRYAFEYARRNGRKKVTCMSKDNIMKMADGLFHNVFNTVAKEYPEIENDHYIIDIGAARIASKPNVFDVIVTENLYGDIISDIAAEVSGSVGLAGSANIGLEYAMFEAIHGSAPDIAGKNIANPSGLLQAAVMLLVHVGEVECASKIQNAWLATIEAGIHTADIYQEGKSAQKVGTMEFAKAVKNNFGKKPSKFAAVNYSKKPAAKSEKSKQVANTCSTEERIMVGVDVFLHGDKWKPEELAQKMEQISKSTRLKLQTISAKGLKVWPKEGILQLSENDVWCCRFVPAGEKKSSTHKDILELLTALAAQNYDFVKAESLYTYDGALGFSVAQGE